MIVNTILFLKNKMTKIIFIGDPHIQTNNIEEVEMFIEKIIILIFNQKPDIVIIGGDVLHYHERLHTLALNKAYELIEKIKNLCKLYVLVGNHDLIRNDQFLTENHWMNGMKKWENLVIVDKVVHIEIDDKLFTLLPYVPNGRFIEALDTNTEKDWMKSNCIFAHQEFVGCKMGHIISEQGDVWDNSYPQIVSGHIHSRQFVQDNIYYPGAALQHAFGESEKNVIAILHFDSNDEKYRLEEKNLELPRKRIIYMNIDEIKDFEIPETQDKIKITIKGNFEEFKTLKKTGKFKKLKQAGINISFKYNGLEKIFDEEQNMIKNINKIDFNVLLSETVLSKKDKYLYQAYEKIIKNNEININDIIFS